ncbi:MAG: hypothetical protein KAS96_09800 [Planctomycetes bacterium]|nr:hypothetical protein [Planctomycetota bacterium]
MTTKETRDMSVAALNSLKKAVRKELKKKAMLGQDAIINRNGKACCVPAEEVLRIVGDN